MSYNAACEALRSAPIPAATYRAARALLDLAPQSGYVELSHDNTKRLVGTEAWGTVRRHLITLQNAGLIMKWLNHSTRVYFVDYPPPAWLMDDPELINLRAKMINLRSPDEGENRTNRANGDHFRAQDDQNRAPGDHFSPSTYTHARTQGWVGLGIDPDLTQSDLYPTQPPATNSEKQPALTEEQERTYRLLIDPEVGLLPDNAERFARMHAFVWVVRHVFGWWDKREKEGLGVGVLVWRLNALGKSKPARRASDNFRASDFWRRHYPLDATGIRRRAYAVDPPPDPLLDALPVPIHVGGVAHE